MLFHLNPSPYVTFVEGTAPSTPSSGKQRVFVRATDGHLCRIDDNGEIWDLDAIGSVLTADPSSPINNTFWVVRDGASPEAVALKVRLNGTTYTLTEITI